MAQARDEAELHGVFRAGEYDRNRLRRRLRRHRGREAAGGNDHVDFALDQLGRELRQELGLALRPAVLDRDVLAVDIAAFLEPRAERVDEVRALVGRAAVQEADEGNGALGAPDEWPGERHRSDPCYELPPFHSITSSTR